MRNFLLLIKYNVGIFAMLRVLNYFFFVEAVDHVDVSPISFCYDHYSCDQETWKGKCVSGIEQSPVDVPVEHKFHRNFRNNHHDSKTHFYINNHYLTENIFHFYGQNNGHTAQFEFTPNTTALSSGLIICGGKLDGCYKFAQLHFHWGKFNKDGSEHTLNGKKYPMELHLVHFKAEYSSLSEALNSTDRDAVAVMAVLFKIGKRNIGMDPIISALDDLTVKSKVKEFRLKIHVSSLYPDIHNDLRIARYLGSLTTPTCDEKVIWTVFLDTVEISEAQMNKFHSLRNEEGISSFNFREPQPLNDRKIHYYSLGQFISLNGD